MALDATLSRWGIMTPRSCVSGMLSMVTVTLAGSWALVVLASNHQCPSCTLYLVHSRRPIGGAIHHRHTQLSRPIPSTLSRSYSL
jgi:hypothetical protein